MRKRLAILSTTALLTIGTPVAALAAPGKAVNDGCGATYGQLVSQARASGHVTGSVSGVRSFVDSGLAAAHGCDV